MLWRRTQHFDADYLYRTVLLIRSLFICNKIYTVTFLRSLFIWLKFTRSLFISWNYKCIWAAGREWLVKRNFLQLALFLLTWIFLISVLFVSGEWQRSTVSLILSPVLHVHTGTLQPCQPVFLCTNSLKRHPCCSGTKNRTNLS